MTIPTTSMNTVDLMATVHPWSLSMPAPLLWADWPHLPDEPIAISVFTMTGSSQATSPGQGKARPGRHAASQMTTAAKVMRYG